MSSSASISVSSNTASMSIMEKYQSLNRGIDDARRDTGALQDETEDYQTRLETLRDGCRTMEQDELVVAQEESLALQAAIQDMRSGTSTTAGASSSNAATTANITTTNIAGTGTATGDTYTTTTATTTICMQTPTPPFDYAFQKRRVDFLKDYIAQQRREFCEESRDFRLHMKRIKLSETSSSSIFLDASVSHAFLQSNGVRIDESDDRGDDDTDNLLENDIDERILSLGALEDQWHEESMASTLPSATAATITRIMDNSDSNHGDDVYAAATAETASAAYKAAFVARNTMEHDYNSCMVARVQAEERASKRQQKLATLQTQLDRIRATISSLTHELTETHDHTTELQAMAESFQQRATAQQQTAALSAAAAAAATRRCGASEATNCSMGGTSNPGRQSNVAPSQPASSSTRRNKTTNPYANSNNTRSINHTTVQRQHPHLAGRIRMDRQFGGISMSGLDVIGGAEVPGVNGDEHDDDSDDDIGDFIAFPRCR